MILQIKHTLVANSLELHAEHVSYGQRRKNMNEMSVRDPRVSVWWVSPYAVFILQCTPPLFCRLSATLEDCLATLCTLYIRLQNCSTHEVC